MVAALDYFSYLNQDDAYNRQVCKVRKQLLGGCGVRRPKKLHGCSDAPFARQAVPSDFCQDIVADQASYQGHLKEAISHPHPFSSDGAAAVPEDLVAAIDNVVQYSKFVYKWRRKQIMVLKQASRAVVHITHILRERQARVTPTLQ